MKHQRSCLEPSGPRLPQGQTQSVELDEMESLGVTFNGEEETDV
jgi:hypothetical protein